jgi:hypothetical protein
MRLSVRSGDRAPKNIGQNENMFAHFAQVTVLIEALFFHLLTPFKSLLQIEGLKNVCVYMCNIYIISLLT